MALLTGFQTATGTLVKNPFVKLFAISFLGALLTALVIKSQEGSTAQGTPLVCDSLNGQCEVLGGIQLNFPEGIKTTGEVPVEFTLPAGTEQLVPKLAVKLEGKTMYMGVNEYQLDLAQGTLYRGNIRIPVCTTEKMDWLMSISVPEANVAPIVYEFSISH